MTSQRMTATVSLLICVLAALGWAQTAFAGATNQRNVLINTTTSTAYGTTHAARTAGNSVERIDCSVSGQSGGTPWATCTAVNSAGLVKQCTSTAAQIVAAAQAISDYSYIYFTWNTAGNCTYLIVNPGSPYLP